MIKGKFWYYELISAVNHQLLPLESIPTLGVFIRGVPKQIKKRNTGKGGTDTP